MGMYIELPESKFDPDPPEMSRENLSVMVLSAGKIKANSKQRDGSMELR